MLKLFFHAQFYHTNLKHLGCLECYKLFSRTQSFTVAIIICFLNALQYHCVGDLKCVTLAMEVLNRRYSIFVANETSIRVLNFD